MWSAVTARAATPPPPPLPLPRRPWTLLALAMVAVASASPAPSSGASPPSADRPRHAPDEPALLTGCRRADPALNTCVRDALNAFLQQAFTKGAPAQEQEEEQELGLGLWALDPLQLSLVNLSDAVAGNLSLALYLRHVQVRGFTGLRIVSARANPQERKLELAGRMPWLSAEGDFSAEGAVLTFPLSAQGAFFVNMTEVSSSWILYFSERPLVAGGPKRFAVDHFEFDFSPVDVTYDFGETLDDDNLLGEAMNAFLNTNAQEVLGDVRARVAEQLGFSLRAVIDVVMTAFPADALLLSD